MIDIISMPLEQLALIEDEFVNELEKDELEELFQRYDKVEIYGGNELEQFEKLVGHSPLGVRKYLEHCVKVYFKELAKPDDGMRINERIIKLYKFDDFRHSVFDNFSARLPNQLYRWWAMKDVSQPYELDPEDVVPVFLSINETLYPGREYANTVDILFPAPNYTSINPDFQNLITVVESCGEEYWRHNARERSPGQYGRSVDDILTKWRYEFEDTYRYPEEYLQYLVEQTHLFMLLLKQGYERNRLTN